jgi:hypothetical protein
MRTQEMRTQEVRKETKTHDGIEYIVSDVS